MKLIYLLEPQDIPFLNLPEPVRIPTEMDFIEYFYKKPNQTHEWNKYRVRPEVAEKVMGS